MKKFSIIIPAYNAAVTLNRCIDSVLQQTFQNFEIILVNDGSTDGSTELCNYYSNYEGVTVINKVNGGLSSARNAGIKKATGEYILFLDADDYLGNNVCEVLNAALTNGNTPDCLDFGIKYINTSGEITTVINKLDKNTLLDKNYLDTFIIPSLLCLEYDPDHFIWEYVCNKAFKLEIIRNNGIFFDDSRRKWEDKPFLLNYLRFCKTYYSIDNCYYYYVNTADSLSQTYDLDFFNIILSNYTLYQEWYGKQFDFNTSYVNGYWCRSIEKMIFRILAQNEDMDIVEQRVVSILQDKRVNKWYKNRIPENKDEEKANKLMEMNNVSDVFSFYKRLFYKEEKKRKMNFLIRTKNKVKRIIGKL